MKRPHQLLCSTLLCQLLLIQPAVAQIVVRDDMGNDVRLAAPARRIVSLAPHVTENIYAAGAGDRLVGAVDYSDYPEAAKKLPRVGGYARLDLEAIVALRPDLIIAWESGNSANHLARLKTLGFPLYLSQPKTIDDVASNIERIGTLMNTSNSANAAAAAFRARHAALRARYAARPVVRTFYQIWNQPLMTVNGAQLISDVMRLCGAENVFSNLPQLAPVVSVEAVLQTQPEAIVASGMNGDRPEWLDMWKPWRQLMATQRNNLFFVPSDLINRHTPRLLDGTQMFCDQMEQTRARRPGSRP